MAGECAFQKNYEGLEVTGRISPKNLVQFARAVVKMLQKHGGVIGASCTFRGHLALSKGTSLGHRKIGSCVFT